VAQPSDRTLDRQVALFQVKLENLGPML
jgi:hypothetical protein